MMVESKDGQITGTTTRTIAAAHICSEVGHMNCDAKGDDVMSVFSTEPDAGTGATGAEVSPMATCAEVSSMMDDPGVVEAIADLECRIAKSMQGLADIKTRKCEIAV